ALAVVFAMLASYFLSRTLVPTMVLYLLPAEARAEAEGGEASESASLTTHHSPLTSFHHSPFTRFHHAFNRGFERLRSTYEGFLDWALDHRPISLTALLGFALGSLLLFPRLGQDFFPSVDAGQFR